MNLREHPTTHVVFRSFSLLSETTFFSTVLSALHQAHVSLHRDHPWMYCCNRTNQNTNARKNFILTKRKVLSEPNKTYQRMYKTTVGNKLNTKTFSQKTTVLHTTAKIEIVSILSITAFACYVIWPGNGVRVRSNKKHRAVRRSCMNRSQPRARGIQLFGALRTVVDHDEHRTFWQKAGMGGIEIFLATEIPCTDLKDPAKAKTSAKPIM